MSCAIRENKKVGSFAQHETIQELDLSIRCNPATEALNQQLYDDNLSKRRRLGDGKYQRLSLSELTIALNSSVAFVDEDMAFPEIVDINSLESSKDSEESALDECRFENSVHSIRKRRRGVVRSRTIPSRMWSLEGESLASLR